jgi:DNA-binding LacI/PurR family transcriptional regulator
LTVIKDVAKLAEVSTGTVSKYFKNPAGLKEKTKIMVEKLSPN